MFPLLRSIFQKKSVALLPSGMPIGETEVVFRAARPLVALNASAHVSVDVSTIVPLTGLEDTMRRIEVAFPPGCIRVAGAGANGMSTAFTKQRVAISATGAFVQLFREEGAHQEAEFSSITVSACRPIPSASVAWVSYGK